MLKLVAREAALIRSAALRPLFLLVFGLALSAACARVSSSPTDQGGGGQSGGAERDAEVFDARPRPPVVPDAIVPPPVTGDGEVCNRELRAVVRDFRTREKDGLPKHPDFDAIIAVDKGIVARMNDRLAIDLGGVHSAQTGTVDLDQQAVDLGLTVGGTYRMALFHAERRCCESNFRLETTLSCIDNIVVP